MDDAYNTIGHLSLIVGSVMATSSYLVDRRISFDSFVTDGETIAVCVELHGDLSDLDMFCAIVREHTIVYSDEITFSKIRDNNIGHMFFEYRGMLLEVLTALITPESEGRADEKSI